MSYQVLSLFEEIAAYEALWDRPDASFRTLSVTLSKFPQCLASSLIDAKVIHEYKSFLFPILKQLPHFGARIDGDGMFPECLKDARYPLKVFYYQGNWALTYQPSIAIVGTRNPTSEGIKRTRALVKKLVNDGFVIVSGLAKGIDTVAHQAAIEFNGITIGVLGPLLTIITRLKIAICRIQSPKNSF